jgi:hypothetical protein
MSSATNETMTADNYADLVIKDAGLIVQSDGRTDARTVAVFTNLAMIPNLKSVEESKRTKMVEECKRAGISLGGGQAQFVRFAGLVLALPASDDSTMIGGKGVKYSGTVGSYSTRDGAHVLRKAIRTAATNLKTIPVKNGGITTDADMEGWIAKQGATREAVLHAIVNAAQSGPKAPADAATLLSKIDALVGGLEKLQGSTAERKVAAELAARLTAW